jgi:hypothetical protein
MMFQLLSLIPIVIVKYSVTAFWLRREKLKSLSLVSRVIGLGGKPCNQLLVN